MNIKFNLGSIVRLIDSKVSMEQLHRQLLPLEGKAGVSFCEPQAGAGYYQWTLAGTGWVSFKDLDDTLKPQAAQKFKDSKAAMSSLLKGSSLVEYIFTVPSEAYIFFRPNGTSLDMALAAWAYKFPDCNAGNALETWQNKTDLQDVHIGFLWTKNKIPHFPFKLEGQPRMTGADGIFYVDRKLPVGKTYSITLESGMSHPLKVEKGRTEYLFDLTQYFMVDVVVKKDGEPVPDATCAVYFGEDSFTLTTDECGHAFLRLPLQDCISDNTRTSQSDCKVECMGETQVQKPMESEETLQYEFNFQPPQKEVVLPPDIHEDPPQPPAPPMVGDVTLTLLDYEGYPLQDMKATLFLKSKGELTVVTDKDGRCTIPQDWFEDRKKVKVKFVVTPEYQRTHDIHRDRKSSKKRRQNKSAPQPEEQPRKK